MLVTMALHRHIPRLELHVSNEDYGNVTFLLLNSTLVNATLHAAPNGSEPLYDHSDALMFIIVTLCVYSIGIAAFVAGHIYKRSDRKFQDQQISEYLSSVYHSELEKVERLDNVRRASLWATSYREVVVQCESVDYSEVKTEDSSTTNEPTDVCPSISVPLSTADNVCSV